MPRVPTYDAPTVQPDSLPGVRQQVPSGLGQGVAIMARQNEAIGQGLQQAGHALELLQIEQDETDATRAHADFIAATTRVLHGDANDPNTPGLLRLPGQRAIDAEAGAVKSLDDTFSSIRDSLKTQRAQQLFAKAATVTRNAADGQIASHVGTAQAQADLDADKRRVDTSGNAAVLAYNPLPGADNSAYETYLETRKAALLSMAQRQGVRADQLDQYIKDGLAPVYAGVVAHLVDNNQPSAAREYLKAHRDRIPDADVQDKLTKMVENAAGTEEALSLALSLKGSLQDKTRKLNDLFKAGTVTSKVRDQALQYVEHDYRVAKEQEQEYTLGLMGKAQQWLIDNPTRSVLEMPGALRIPLQARGHLDSLLSFARNGRYVNDPQVWAELASMSPQELAKMTPQEFELAYRGKLDDQHLQQGLAAVKAARNQPLDGQTLELVTNGEMVKRKAQQSGLLPITGKPTEEQTTQFESFEAEVQRRLDEVSRQLGGTRKPSRKELEQVVDSVLLDKVFVDEWGRDPKRPVSALTADQQSKAYVTVGKQEIYLASIPEDQRKQIVAKLIARNLAVTEQAIAATWVEAGKPK